MEPAAEPEAGGGEEPVAEPEPVPLAQLWALHPYQAGQHGAHPAGSGRGRPSTGHRRPAPDAGATAPDADVPVPEVPDARRVDPPASGNSDVQVVPLHRHSGKHSGHEQSPHDNLKAEHDFHISKTTRETGGKACNNFTYYYVL